VNRRERNRLAALCRKVQALGGVSPTAFLPARLTETATRFGLVVSGRTTVPTIATTEAGYMLAHSLTEAEAEDALELPLLLGLESVL